MRIQSNYAVWRTQIRPNKRGRVHPFGWISYNGESVAYKGAAGDLRTLQVYSPAAIPTYTRARRTTSPSSTSERDSDGNLTVTASDPVHFLRTRVDDPPARHRGHWAAYHAHDAVPALRDGAGLQRQRAAPAPARGVEREISAMVREHFEQQRAAAGEAAGQEAAEGDKETALEGVELA